MATIRQIKKQVEEWKAESCSNGKKVQVIADFLADYYSEESNDATQLVFEYLDELGKKIEAMEWREVKR